MTTTATPTDRPEILDRLSASMQEALANRARYGYRTAERGDGILNASTFDALRRRGLIETETRDKGWGFPQVCHSFTEEALAVGRWILANGVEKKQPAITRGAPVQILAWLRKQRDEYVESYQGQPGGLSTMYACTFSASAIARACGLKLSTTKGAIRRLRDAGKIRCEEYTASRFGAKFTKAQLERCEALDRKAQNRQAVIIDALRERGVPFEVGNGGRSVKIKFEDLVPLLGLDEYR